MKKRWITYSIISLMISFFANESYSQGQKFVFAEGFGAGMLLSANYDMRFQAGSREGMGFRAGVGSGILLGFWDATLNFPVGINYVKGKNKSAFIMGVNLTTSILSNGFAGEAGVKAIPSLEIGYRFRPITKGLAFQVTYNPTYLPGDEFYPLYGGIGIGYAW